MYQNIKQYGVTGLSYVKTVNGLVTSSYSAPIGQTGYLVRNGSDNINRKFQIKKMIDATTAYTRTWERCTTFGGVSATTSYPPLGWVIKQWGWLPISVYPYHVHDVTIDRDIASAKIKAKIDSDRGDFAMLSNVLEDVYELRRTINGTFDAVGDLLKGLKRLATQGGGKSAVAKAAADLWLQWSFGINPTISDANEMIDSLKKYLDRENHVKHFQAYHHTDAIGSANGTYTLLGATYKYNVRQFQRSSVKLIAALDFQLVSGNNYGVKQHFHLSPTDIVPMLWELLPWSWLIDYLTTAGAFLRDTFESRNDKFVYALENDKLVNNYIVTGQVTASPPYTLVTSHFDHRIYKNGSFVRTPKSYLPRRTLRFKTSDEIGNNALTKLLNLAAILMTR